MLLHDDMVPSAAVMCREYVDEERTEKQVAAVMQKTLEHQGSHGQKFYYAMNRSAQMKLAAAKQSVLISPRAPH